ncbi:MAG TPA: hypothetical protein DCM87_20485 [Planctomycetes bacterium]|nr:hypothetical protein [Planctomycetota bacterium]
MSCLLAIVFSGALSAQPAPLLGVVPRDAAAAVWWRINPERAFVRAHIEKVLARAREAEFGGALLDLVEQLGGMQARLGMQGGAAMLAAVFGEVDYGNLLAEGAAALDLAPAPGVRIALRPADPARAFRELAACLGAAARMAGNAVVVKAEGEQRVVFTLTRAQGVEVCLARLDDLVVLASGRALVDAVEATRAGQRPGLPANAKWRAAAALLPEPEDSAYFLDLEQLGALGGRALASVPRPEEGPAAVAAAVIGDLLEELGVLRLCSHAAGVSWTDGRVFKSASVTALAGGWRETPIGAMLAGSEPELVPFDRVPAGATSVAFQAGCDPAPVAGVVLAVLKKRLGAAQVEGVVREFKETAGIEPGELARMLMGAQLQYQVKSMKPSLLGAVDQSVLAVRVRDAAAMSRCLDAVERNVLAGELREMLKVEPLEGFPPLRCARFGGLPMGAFAWGVRDDTFYFSTDADVLAESLRGDSAGGAPFLWREDLRLLGLIVPGPVYAYSYMDLGRLIINLSQVLTMAGMGAAFVPAGEPGAEQARRLFAFVPRVAGVLRHVDFFGGMASMTTFDARGGRLLSFRAVEVKAAPSEPRPSEAPPDAQGKEPPRQAF